MVSKTLFCRKCKWFCRSTGRARMTDWDVLVQFTLYCDLSISFSNAITKFKGSSPCYGRCRYIARIIPDTRPSGSLRSRKIAPGDFFPPTGEDDGLGSFRRNNEFPPAAGRHAVRLCRTLNAVTRGVTPYEARVRMPSGGRHSVTRSVTPSTPTKKFKITSTNLDFH